MSSNSPQPYQLQPWLDLQAQLTGLEMISVGLGPDYNLYVLTAVPPLDYREQQAGASFAKIRTGRPNDFAIFRYDGENLTRFDIRQQSWNFHHVQPLPDDEFLLVCSRSYFRSTEDYDLNGQVFGLDGVFKRAFLLGDGIRDVQTTSKGQIWTSYFDEGVFGNYGWRKPIGRSGLIRWDQFGAQQYTYRPAYALDVICDCYALNVASKEDVWCYYYTDFPLVQIRRDRVEAAWNCPIEGSDGFTIWRDKVLMRGGYGHRDTYHLLQMLPQGRMQLQADYQFLDEQGEPLTGTQVAVRSYIMILIHEERCYRLDMREFLTDTKQR